MDDETDTGIRPEIDEYPEAGPFWVGLWAVARHWVALLEDIFEPNVIASTGITRSFALRCGKWLWSIEGLVRRLIIAAAMKLDSTRPARLTRGKERPSTKAKPASSSFIVLPRVPGRSTHTPETPRTTQPPPEHRHLIVPGDSLLNLFRRHDRRNAPPASHRSHNPLKRRGRLSRWDPDYQGSPGRYQVIEEGDVVYTSFMILGRQLTPLEGRARPEPRPRTRADRTSPYWKPPGGYAPEWKRIELEWERVIPSPRLAGRIRALLRVLEHPERWIERTARRLTGEPGSHRQDPLRPSAPLQEAQARPRPSAAFQGAAGRGSGSHRHQLTVTNRNRTAPQSNLRDREVVFSRQPHPHPRRRPGPSNHFQACVDLKLQSKTRTSFNVRAGPRPSPGKRLKGPSEIPLPMHHPEPQQTRHSTGIPQKTFGFWKNSLGQGRPGPMNWNC